MAVSRIDELERCSTLEDVDAFLHTQNLITTQDKCQYLIDYMGVVGFYFDDGENEPEPLYSLLRESFCDGDWRLLCGERK